MPPRQPTLATHKLSDPIPFSATADAAGGRSRQCVTARLAEIAAMGCGVGSPVILVWTWQANHSDRTGGCRSPHVHT